MSQPEASADLASLQAEPDGALHLTPEQRAAMAVMRGVHVPPFELSLSRFGGKNTPASAQPLVDAVSEILRPRDAEILKKYAAQFPAIKTFSVDEVFGGWTKAFPAHFKDGGSFDRIYQSK